MCFNIENFKDDFKLKMLQTLKEKFEALDWEIFRNRNKKRYISVKIINRSILTDMGLVTFKRHIYKYYNKEKEKWKYIALVDKEIGIKKYSKIIYFLKEKMLSFIGDGKRYRDILDTIPNVKISTMTVSRLFKNFKKIKYQNKITLKDNQNLYIMTDEAYTNCRIKKKKVEHKIRVVTFSTGLKQKPKFKSKPELENKKATFIFQKVNDPIGHSNFVKFVKSELSRFYNNWENAKIIVGGDGANWIVALGKSLKANQMLSDFHLRARARNTFSYNIGGQKMIWSDWISYKKFFSFLENEGIDFAYDFLVEFKNKISKNQKLKIKVKKARELMLYMRTNWEALKNYCAKWYIGVSAESDVSHITKSIKGYGAKIYNHKTYHNMLIAKVNKINNY